MEFNNQYLVDHLRSIQDFPHEGINFRDVTTLFKDAKALENVQKYGLNNLSKAEFETLFVETGFKEVAIHTKEGTDWLCVEGVK